MRFFSAKLCAVATACTIASVASSTLAADKPAKKEDEDGRSSSRAESDRGRGQRMIDAVFARIDKDGNGSLSKEEFGDAMKRFHAMARRRGRAAGRWSDRGPGGPDRARCGQTHCRRSAMRWHRPGMDRHPRWHGQRGTRHPGWGHPCCCCCAHAHRAWRMSHKCGYGTRRGEDHHGGPAAGRRDRWRHRSARGKPGVTAIVTRFDKNEDGKLAENEVPDRIWNRIRRADKNDDGHVSKPELRAMVKKHGKQHRKHQPPRARRGRRGPSDKERPRAGVGRGGSPPDADRVFRRFDEDNNGRLSEVELPGFLWRRLADADQDGDDQISKEEFQQANLRIPRRGARRDQGGRPRDQQRTDASADRQSRSNAHDREPSGESAPANNSEVPTSEMDSSNNKPSG